MREVPNSRAVFLPILIGSLSVACGESVDVVDPGAADAGDGSAAEGATDGAADRAEFVEQVVSAWCDAIGPCCEASGFGFEQHGCRESVRARETARLAELSPGLGYDPTMAVRCVEFIKSAAQACSVGFAMSPEYVDVCNSVFRGDVGLGANCALEDDDCAPAAGHATECRFGECVLSHTHEPLQLGEDCSYSCWSGYMSAGCHGEGEDVPGSCFGQDGLYCDEVMRKCVLLPEAGQPCAETSFQCADDAWCNGMTCSEAAAVGDPCGGDFAACVRWARCDADSGRCVELMPDGAPCMQDAECQSARCMNDRCHASANPANPSLCGVE